MGSVLLERGKPDQAMGYFAKTLGKNSRHLKARELGGENPAIMDTLGWIYYNSMIQL